jgi:dihydrofolate synthase/folylpolyglutamate synthase
MLAALRADEFDVVITCTAPSPRGLPAEELSIAARELGCDDVVQAETVEEAIDMARADSMAEDAIVVTGSLYIVGAARPYLRKVIN